ncbi:MAG: HEAT repeat domain-containing protein [Planctomycetota bacterium]|nr:HEAT repeat domain-containing protein [Planctomycetota bacterium]
MLEILALAAILAQSPAATPLPVPSTESTAAAQDAKGTRRILRLANGQSIRVLSRWRDGAWEYKGRSGWDRLDPRAVTGAELEADVLRAWRAERAASDAKDLDARCRLARSAAQRGLATEALAELDAVLGAQPDHPAALAVLRDTWLLSVPTLDVPAGEEAGARAELLRFGSSLPPAGREVAVQQLARSRDRAGLQSDLARDLWSPIVVRRSFAALALRRILPGEEVRPLLVHSVRDASEDVRRESARALGSAGDPALVLPLTKALGSASLAIRSNAASALGEMGYPAAVEPLVARMAAALQSSTDARAPHSNIFVGRQIAYVQDFDVEVAQFQAVADPQVNVLLEGNVLDAGVISTREEGVEVELVAIRQALEKIVRQRPGGTAREWLRWWEKEAAHWRAADHAAPSTRAGG